MKDIYIQFPLKSMGRRIVAVILMAVLCVGCGSEDVGTANDPETTSASVDNKLESGIESLDETTDEESDVDTVDYESIYTDFAKEVAENPSSIGLNQSDSDGTYMRIVDVGEPVLLITDGTFDYSVNEPALASHAYVFAYNPEEKQIQEVVYFASTGTGYPILLYKGYLLAGFHHKSMRLKVKNGIGIMETIDNLYLNKKELKRTITRVSNHKETVESEESIPIKKESQEGTYDFYANACADSSNFCEYLSFMKIE